MKKTLKKGRFAVLLVLLLLVLLTFLIGETAGVYVTGTLNDAGLRSAYVTRLMDSVYDNLGSTAVDKLEQVQADIEARPEISSITEKYTEAFVKGIWNNQSYDEIDVDISDEMDGLMNFVVDEIKEYVEIPSFLESVVTQLIMSQEQAATDAVKAYAASIYENLQNNYEMMIKAYYVLTSEVFLRIMFALAVLLIIIIIATTPLSAAKFGIPAVAVVTGILYILAANLCAGKIVMTLSNKMLGRTVMLDTSRSVVLLSGLIAVTVVGTVILFIADAIAGRKKKSEAQ